MYDCLFVQHKCLVASGLHHTSLPLRWDSAAKSGNARNCKLKIAQKLVRFKFAIG